MSQLVNVAIETTVKLNCLLRNDEEALRAYATRRCLFIQFALVWRIGIRHILR